MDSYRATLGHKINYSAKPNVEYDFIFHPRFGEIRSVRTMTHLKAGTELTSMYAKMVDDYVFLKQIMKDFDTYNKLGGEDKISFLDDMKSNYQQLLYNIMGSVDMDNLYKHKNDDAYDELSL